MIYFLGICDGMLDRDSQFFRTKDYTDETLCHQDLLWKMWFRHIPVDLIMESLFAKILIFVHLMEMYNNTTKKLSENTISKKYMSYVVTCSIYQPG